MASNSTYEVGEGVAVKGVRTQNTEDGMLENYKMCLSTRFAELVDDWNECVTIEGVGSQL